MAFSPDVMWLRNGSGTSSAFGGNTTFGDDFGLSSEAPRYDPNPYLSKYFEDMIRREIYNSMLSYDSPFTIFLMALYGAAFVSGLLGNVFVILVVLRHEKMRTVTNVFLVNLALGDLLVVVFCMPFSLAPHVYRNWIYGRAICKLPPFVQGTSVGVSVFSLLSISVDRFLAILNPMKARILCSKAKVKLMVVVIWLVAMTIALPLAVVTDVTSNALYGPIKLYLCEEHWESLYFKNVYNICLFVLLYCLPVICMIVTYCKISRVLWYGDRSIYSSDASENPEHARRVISGRRRIVRMLILLVAIFAALWLPYHVINIYLDLNRSVGNSPAIAMYGYPIVQWLALANSSTNPICYCFMSKSFRDSFKAMCVGKGCQIFGTSKYSETTVVSQGIGRERKTPKIECSVRQRAALVGDETEAEIKRHAFKIEAVRLSVGEAGTSDSSDGRLRDSSGNQHSAYKLQNGNSVLRASALETGSMPCHLEARL